MTDDLISRAAAITLCDEYPYVEGVKEALQELPAVPAIQPSDPSSKKEPLMAWSDYKICDCCGNAKVFYDANIQDARYQATWGEPSDYDPIGLKAICGECNKTHEVVIAPRKKESADRIEELEAKIKLLEDELDDAHQQLSYKI